MKSHRQILFEGFLLNFFPRFGVYHKASVYNMHSEHLYLESIASTTDTVRSIYGMVASGESELTRVTALVQFSAKMKSSLREYIIIGRNGMLELSG